MNLLADYSWLWWILIGALAGGIAKFIMPGRDPGGCLITIALGIGGAAGYSSGGTAVVNAYATSLPRLRSIHAQDATAAFHSGRRGGST